jgi:hypothetical protein
MDVVAVEQPQLYFEVEFEIEMGGGGVCCPWRRARTVLRALLAFGVKAQSTR